jgi:hypothetical protein
MSLFGQRVCERRNAERHGGAAGLGDLAFMTNSNLVGRSTGRSAG